MREEICGVPSSERRCLRRLYGWWPGRRASSLVISLLVIMVLTITAVAFFQATSLARTTAKSYRNLLEADLAADSGLQMAVSQILLAVGTNQSFVTGQVDYPSGAPLTVIGRKNLTNYSQLMPLISGPTNLLTGFGEDSWSGFTNYAAARASTEPRDSVNVNTPAQFIQQTNNAAVFRAPWVTVTNISGGLTNYSRYAYIVLDEQARLNPIIHNGTGPGATNATNWYGGPQDIRLAELQAPVLTASQVSTINGASNVFANSHESIAQTFASRAEYEAVKHLFTTQTNPSFDFIPAWLPDGGKPKYNINDLATNSTYGDSTARAENIAGIIRKNFPKFSSRDPAYRGSDEMRYLNRLCANIVDYIDADAQLTSVNSGEPSGQEVLPLPTLIAMRIKLVSMTPTKAELETQFFVQVWNPNTTPALLPDNSKILLTVRGRPLVHFGTGIVRPMPDYVAAATAGGGVAVRPNEFVVLTFPTTTDVYESPTSVATPELFWAKTPAGTQDNNAVPFMLSFNGQVVAASRRTPLVSESDTAGGIDQDDLTLRIAQINDTRWICSFIPMNPTYFVGDPRLNSFVNVIWSSAIARAEYMSETWWKGRQRDGGDDAHLHDQDFAKSWVNRDYVPRNPSIGRAAGGPTITPDMDAFVKSQYKPAADGPAAVGVIRDGPMVSIGELGHIYDPALADDLLDAPSIAINFDPLSPGYGSSTRSSGGGRTLRVGQPEFDASGGNSWNTNGRRALELLDLFSVNTTNQGIVGRINPNTAPPEVLAASLAGIRTSSDTGIAPASLINLTNVANTIVTNRPYQSLADLYRVTPAFAAATNYNPAFTSSMGGGTTNLAAVDRVREEVFGKWIQHLSVQSRAYRIYVVGQTLDKNQNPRGNAIIEATLYLKFNETDGRFEPVLQYERALK